MSDESSWPPVSESESSEDGFLSSVLPKILSSSLLSFCFSRFFFFSLAFLVFLVLALVFLTFLSSSFSPPALGKKKAWCKLLLVTHKNSCIVKMTNKMNLDLPLARFEGRSESSRSENLERRLSESTPLFSSQLSSTLYSASLQTLFPITRGSILLWV